MAVALQGCSFGGDTPSDVAAVRVDSAGIEIVTTSAAAEAAPTFAVIDSIPDLRIGSLQGESAEQFGAIEDVIALRDGGLAVLDGQSAEVRFFDSFGQFQGAVGGKGDGPGEFQAPVTLAQLPGDTIAVFDPALKRVTRFGPDRATPRVTTLQDAEMFLTDARFLGDGRLVGQSHWLAPGGGASPSAEPVLVRDTVVLTLFDAEGRVADTMDIVPGREEIVSIRLSPGAVSVRKRPAVFARANLFAPGGDRLWSSSNDRFELRLRELDSGRLVRIVRLPGFERSATSEMARTIHGEALAEAETAEQRSWLRTWLDLSPLPEFQPAYDIIQVDHRERLWVRAWSPSGDGGRWWVFDTGGALLGSVDVRSGVRITSVRCGFALGVEQDEYGVDYAVRYPVRGPDDC